MSQKLEKTVSPSMKSFSLREMLSLGMLNIKDDVVAIGDRANKESAGRTAPGKPMPPIWPAGPSSISAG